MHAAILCPGPSLPVRYGGVHDLVIAVNAAIQFAADVNMWCCFDWQSFGKFGNEETPIICRKDVWRIGIESGVQYKNPLAFLVDPEAIDTPPDVDGRYQWSSCGAVISAYMLGASEITLFGCDMSGKKDFLGRAGSGRCRSRWENERKSLSSLVDWMTGKNVYVRLS